MSFQHLVGGECGGNNSLVQFSNILSRDTAINAGPSGSHVDQYVNEYMSQNATAAPPQTFQMNTLLQSLKELHPDPSMSAAQGNQWRDEFAKQQVMHQQPPSWNMASSSIHRLQPMLLPNNVALNHNFGNMNFGPIQYSSESFDPSNYMVESSMIHDIPNNDVVEKARELVDTVADENVAYSQFVSFMKKIGGGEASLVMPESAVPQQAMENVLSPEVEKFDEFNKDEWAKFKKDLNDQPWLSSVDLSTNPFPTYSFAQQNSELENPNALEIGKQKLKLGDVPGAVLCFEATVKQDPKLVEGWLLLGTTQAENEQDPQAIAALNKCVELDPTCLNAYMALGSSYTNENYPHFAYKAFNDWLKANREYSDLVPLDVDISNMSNSQLQEHIQSLFLRAAQMNPSKVDSDIQCALGVLFNISQEYSKAVDCFRAALMVRGDDSRLWNKLGATLANGERSEEAVNAYYQALSLEPGFIRARYNIGITCMNLGAYKEAAEHFLTALNQQAKAQGMVPNVAHEDMSSSTIWSTLKMVCAFMGRHELSQVIDDRNLSQLNRHFDIE